MVCILCQSETQVFNSRLHKKPNQVWRRRRCAQGHVFTTHEVADYDALWLVRGSNGRLSPFARDKLFISLFASLQHRKTSLKDAGALADTVIQKLTPAITDGNLPASTITTVAQVALNRFDKPASVHYQAMHPLK
jgi:transcriptional regulator NrdR family protein